MDLVDRRAVICHVGIATVDIIGRLQSAWVFPEDPPAIDNLLAGRPALIS